MKTLLLLFFLAGGSAALADGNILMNGDFANGIAHWEGDCHSAGSATDDSGAASGIVVKLKSSDWTRVTQQFEGKPGNYLLTITYTVSPHTTFSQRPKDYSNGSNWRNMDGFFIFDSAPGKWTVIVDDMEAHHYYNREITPKLDGSGPQTVTENIELGSEKSTHKGFFLGFPPGSGSINLQSITLVAKNSTPSSP